MGTPEQKGSRVKQCSLVDSPMQARLGRSPITAGTMLQELVGFLYVKTILKKRHQHVHASPRRGKKDTDICSGTALRGVVAEVEA